MIVIFFIYGLIIGSFLNVCIYRIPYGKSVIVPGSSCESCGHKLKFKDMIPVVSYITDKGKCRYCGHDYSVQYPFIELLNAFMYSFTVIKFGFSFNSVIIFLIISTLIVLSVIDFKYKVIYDRFHVIGVIVGVIYIVFDTETFIYKIIGLMIGFLIFFAIAVFTNALGGGDVKLMAVIGFIFGIEGILFVTFFSFITGALTATLLIILRVKDRKDEIPFGPFVSISVMLYIFFGSYIIDWYLSIWI